MLIWQLRILWYLCLLAVLRVVWFEVAVSACWQQGALILHPRSFISCPEPSPPTTGSVVCVSQRSNITADCECHLGYILSLSSWWLDFILSVESVSKLASWADKSGHPLILWWLNSSAVASVSPGKRPLPGNSVWFFFNLAAVTTVAFSLIFQNISWPFSSCGGSVL